MASTLLACAEAILIGRALSFFVQEGQRMAFRHRLGPLIEAELPQVWHFRMRSWLERPFAAEVVVSPLRGARGRVSALAWLIQDISERSHTAAAPME
jgi:hypothetical protein